MQMINEIAEGALMKIRKRKEIYLDFGSLRNEFNSLFDPTGKVTHEQLNTMINLQRQVLKKADQLPTLLHALFNHTNLDSQLLSCLNVDISNLLSGDPQITEMLQSSVRSPDLHVTITNSGSTNNNYAFNSVFHPMESSTDPTIHQLVKMDSIVPAPIATTLISLENNASDFEANIEPQELTNNQSANHVTNESLTSDQFDPGYTSSIIRQNPTVINSQNDKFAGTLCCYENQLLFNDYHQRLICPRLTFIPDVSQPTVRQHIAWTQPDTSIGGGDDSWIQDIVYSTKLNGYFLLNRARLRLLRSDTLTMEEFDEFPDYSMKRVACDETSIYLISASGSISQNGDEVIVMDYTKQDKVFKTFRDLILMRSKRAIGSLIGEITDIAVGRNGQVILSYRYERRHDVGTCLYKVTNHGNEWSFIRRLLLSDCWRDDVFFTPRVEWCDNLNVFILVEYLTGHLIMIDQTGGAKGECHMTHTEVQREAPLNISSSANNWLCVRYKSSINVYRLEDARF
ncbi:unnamed protein product [Adineta ricciae]|uniref:Uncharacterized protein n=1 Tax=Adineta ricciae TaxID=249248 RepID=A0A814X039_ADIRI|nr:unnamed protein product [Adineta ricciae]CAF1209396.1 unnamed protein product [Adineta ricciae]